MKSGHPASARLLRTCTDDAEIVARVRTLGHEMPPRESGRRWMMVFSDGAAQMHAVFWFSTPGDSGLSMLTFLAPTNPFDEVRLRAELLAIYRATEGAG